MQKLSIYYDPRDLSDDDLYILSLERTLEGCYGTKFSVNDEECLYNCLVRNRCAVLCKDSNVDVDTSTSKFLNVINKEADIDNRVGTVIAPSPFELLLQAKEKAHIRDRLIVTSITIHEPKKTIPKPTGSIIDPVIRQQKNEEEKIRSKIIRELKPNTVLNKMYKGKEYRVLVLDDGYEMDQRIYPTLYSVVVAITGLKEYSSKEGSIVKLAPCSGSRFFGLR